VSSALRNRSEPIARSASSAAADLIRQAIIDGRLPAGERLKEIQLAGELGISRTPIREALRILAAEDLVEITPNRGARIRTYTAAELDDMYQLRALLEGYAARRAATRLKNRDLERLRASCRRFARLSTGDSLVELVQENLVFHQTILEAAASERLKSMVRKAIEIPLVYRSYHWYSPEQRRESEVAHRQLTQAFEERDSELAEQIMKEHVFRARDVLMKHMETMLPLAESLRRPLVRTA
jgi:DNA-binding GntR family transcriptional regulator